MSFDSEPSSHEPDLGLTMMMRRQEQAWHGGEHIPLEQLLAELPPTTDRQEAILELVHNEVALREHVGESPQLEEYLARFPEAAEALRTQWEIDALLSDAEAEEDESAPVHRIGRYQIQGEVGRGAMGIVYRAWDPRLKRIVAIKRLRGGADASPEELQRIRVEAEASARIRHDNVVQIHDVGEHEGQPYLAMELCAGGSLASLLREQPLAATDAARMVAQIADGVAAAHASQVLHRDLKPANILLTDSVPPRPKVTDFGLAKQLDDDHQATATGAILGTPAYMAPEQAFGLAVRPGTAADIYAIGAVLYECLTGRPPFRGATIAETLEQVRLKEPVAVTQLRPGIPWEMETITHKCLRKEPSQRYRSAAELSDDLRRFLRREPIQARRETWIQAVVRTFRRYPVTATSIAMACVLLVTIAVGSLIFAKRSERLGREARLGQAEALVGRAHGIRLSRRSGQRFEALAAIRQAVAIGRELKQPTSWYDPIRDEAIAALMLPDAYVETWRDETSPAQAASLSDDHRRYAIAFSDQELIQLRELADHREIARIPRVDKITYVRFAGPDLLFQHGFSTSASEMWDVARSPPKRIWRIDSGCRFFDFTRDNQLLAMTDVHHLRVIDANSGSLLAESPVAPFTREGYVAIHPVLPLVLLYSYHHPSIQLRDWQHGETLQSLVPGAEWPDESGFTGADWSPDGRKLFLVQGESAGQYEYALDLSPPRLRLLRHSRPAKFTSGARVQYNFNGDRIHSFGWGSVLEIVDASSETKIFMSPRLWYLGGDDSKPYVDPRGECGGFFLRPDHPKSVGRMMLADGREARVVVPPDLHVVPVSALDPTGQFLVAVRKEGLIFVDWSTGRMLAELNLPDIAPHHLAFDRQGGLFIMDYAGCFRWPCAISSESPDRIELGVPQRVHVPAGHVAIASDDAGQTLVGGAWNGFGTHMYSGCWLKTPGEPAARKVLGNGSSGACTISPGGRYAVGRIDSTGLLVWDCAQGVRRLRDIGVPMLPSSFSRDGKWLLAAGKRWSVDTWQAGKTIEEGDPVELSPDGSMILSVRGDGVICLVDSETSKTLGRFEWKDPEVTNPRFSPDGNQFWLHSEGGVVAVDLVRIRERLKELELDWDSGRSNGRTRLAPHDATSKRPLKSGAIPSPLAPDTQELTVEIAPELIKVETMEQLVELVDRRGLEAADQSPEDGYAAFSAAMVAIDQRDFDLALRHLDRSCVLLRDALTPRQWRAYLHAARRDFSAAIVDADWVLQKGMSLAVDAEEFAAQSSSESQPSTVMSSATNPTVATPTLEPPLDDDFRLLRAEWCLRAGRVNEALAECSRVIQWNGWSTKFAYGLRAACHEALGHPELALADQAKFIELTRFDASSLEMAADPMTGADISLWHPTIALRIVRKIQSLTGEPEADVRQTVGITLYRNDLFAEAEEWIGGSLSSEPRDTDGANLLMLAMSQFRRGDKEQALATMARATAWQIPQSFDADKRRALKRLRNEAERLIDPNLFSRKP